jgi:hypothetical protein
MASPAFAKCLLIRQNRILSDVRCRAGKPNLPRAEFKTENEMRRMTILATVLFIGVSGCAPSPPKPEELGRVVYDPSEVPGMDKPYHPPELDELKSMPSMPSMPGKPPMPGMPPMQAKPPGLDTPPKGDGLPEGEAEKNKPDDDEDAAPVEIP